jgi:hypothetical protein
MPQHTSLQHRGRSDGVQALRRCVREALAEPDVTHPADRHVVAEPLVRQLVGERAQAADTGELGPGLGLHLIAGIGDVDDRARLDNGDRVERPSTSGLASWS